MIHHRPMAKSEPRISQSLQEMSRLRSELRRVRSTLDAFCHTHRQALKGIHPRYELGAKNLLHYLALRRLSLKDLQFSLADVGLSSLGRCESHVLGNIDQVLARLNESLSKSPRKRVPPTPPGLNWHLAEKLLHQHTQDLFGPRPSNRHVYIMVTAPGYDEFEEPWVRRILESGANLIRINCAHDKRTEWRKMVLMIRKISAETGHPCKIHMDLGGPKIRTFVRKPIKLSKGDRLELVGKLGERKGQVQCSIPTVLNDLLVGHRVCFDDGKIECRVLHKTTGQLVLEVLRVPAPATKLRSEKGINFPDSHLKISGITAQDLRDLDFVAAHADAVGLSFVQSPEVIRTMRREIKRRTDRKLGIVLKIETQAGFEALPRLLLEAMHGYPCGVMIARGDLGVEVGFERMVEVQEEILWLCEAAHVPTIWATQVLETEAKSGLPSRAEVTDAASAVRAECVMLNKGPFIDVAVRSLDNILRRMEFHTYKKRQLYRELKVATSF